MLLLAASRLVMYKALHFHCLHGRQARLAGGPGESAAAGGLSRSTAQPGCAPACRCMAMDVRLWDTDDCPSDVNSEAQVRAATVST